VSRRFGGSVDDLLVMDVTRNPLVIQTHPRKALYFRKVTYLLKSK
jgi:hypothetical protein